MRGVQRVEVVPSRARTWDRLFEVSDVIGLRLNPRHRNGDTLAPRLSLGCLTQGAGGTQCAIANRCQNCLSEALRNFYEARRSSQRSSLLGNGRV